MYPLLTTQQVCKATSLSRSTIWRMQQRNEFPQSVRLSTARVAFCVGDIDAWIASRKRGGEQSIH
ncbi:AlpA family phage regulatory protein [Rhizobium sp. TH2]|uniref:helix-turn-helix transcriptional regulator n=1 Tax=Rhizobium sp. TH2 TaxID=2775403 RepID=UPI002157AFA4|nr:AlpA family phage regulatory protein [Rhizobium sp. TH2]UVC10524.1 AlpA family phage regulatory protein [Rhizobium sp. TH2]